MNSPPAFDIRRLVESDLPGVLIVAESALEAPRWPRQTFVEMLSGEFLSRRIALVVTLAGASEVIGFAVASLVAHEAELENIAVAPEAQRRGVGRQLLAKLVSELRRSGVETLHLEVRASNRAAICLYNSFGFNETGHRPRYYSGPIEDAILMAHRLG